MKIKTKIVILLKTKNIFIPLHYHPINIPTSMKSLTLKYDYVKNLSRH